MKKIFVLAFISMAALVACSSEAAPSPTVTITESVQAPQQDSYDDGTTNLSNEEIYLLGVKSANNPILNSASDSELLEVGYSVCDILDQGFTTDDIIAYMAREMVNDGLTSEAHAEAVGYIIGAAESALCPSDTF